MAYPKPFPLASPPKPQQATFAPDLSVRLICPDCRVPNTAIIEEFGAGDLVCRGCGLVHGDRVVDTRSEWRVRASHFFSTVSSCCNPILVFFRPSKTAKATTHLVLALLPTLLWRGWNSSMPSLVLRTVARAPPANFSARHRAPRTRAPGGTSFPLSAISQAGVTSFPYQRRSATLPSSFTSGQTRRSCSAGSRWTPSSRRASLLHVARHTCPARSARSATSPTYRRRSSAGATRS